ncbi:hypothetical protein JXB41_01300 [Candidatus Woesearchaeota archaeon]|nr:hypothetical protein [Candidatus Woesearchaeota archaeon]
MDETLIVKRNEIRKRLIPMEWDKKLKQINSAKDQRRKEYRLELEKIEKEIAGGQDGESI